MSIKVNYKTKSFKKLSNNLVLFTDEKFSLSPLKKYISNFEFSYINDLLNSVDLKKNVFIFELSSKKKIALLSLKKNISSSDVENLGAEFYNKINLNLKRK